MAVGVMILAGCAGMGTQEEGIKESSLGIEWRSAHWRLCEQGKCQRPTPKTIAIAPALSMKPTVKNQAQAASQESKETKAQASVRKVVVLFPFNSAIPTEEGAQAIALAAKNARSGETLFLDGYTDSIGGKGVNDELAAKRAKHVAAELKRLDVKAAIEIQGEGKCCYVAANDSEDGRSANRRVEIHFSSTPNTKAKE